jgi:RNA:NAD 2'-phosphotransferase (TPT1/KptA family)
LLAAPQRNGRVGSSYTADDVRDVVEHNDKRRYELRDVDERASRKSKQVVSVRYVRAAHGHSIQKVTRPGTRLTLDARQLAIGCDASGVPVAAAPAFAVHGTYSVALEGESSVMRRGLHRMGRNQVHDGGDERSALGKGKSALPRAPLGPLPRLSPRSDGG